MPPNDSPNHRYYRSMHGRWSSPYSLELTDDVAFAKADLAPFDRLRVRLMVVSTRWFGPMRLETEVDYESHGADGRVVHRLRISKWGMTFLRSDEVLVLDPNGRDVTMSGEQRLVPDSWRRRPFEGARATIDESGERADYTIPMMGVALRQTTRPAPYGLRLEQETSWCRAVSELRRR